MQELRLKNLHWGVNLLVTMRPFPSQAIGYGGPERVTKSRGRGDTEALWSLLIHLPIPIEKLKKCKRG